MSALGRALANAVDLAFRGWPDAEIAGYLLRQTDRDPAFRAEVLGSVVEEYVREEMIARSLPPDALMSAEEAESVKAAVLIRVRNLGRRP